MTGYADIHSHFVYGVDDGAGTQADMEAMLDAAWQNGIVSLWATPHIAPGIRPFDMEAYLEHVEQAKQYCQSRQYDMTIETGAEILHNPALSYYIAQHSLPTLAHSDRVLLEFLPDTSFQEVRKTLETLEDHGYRAILAHIERYDCMHKPGNVRRLKEQFDVLYQVNASTLFAQKGFFRSRRIRGWFQKGLVDRVASDAHGVKNRTFMMNQAYEKLVQEYGKSAAKKLTGAAAWYQMLD